MVIGRDTTAERQVREIPAAAAAVVVAVALIRMPGIVFSGREPALVAAVAAAVAAVVEGRVELGANLVAVQSVS